MPRAKKPVLPPVWLMVDFGIPIPEERKRKYKRKPQRVHTMPPLDADQQAVVDKLSPLVRLIQVMTGEGAMAGELGTQSHQISFPSTDETLFYRRDRPETTLSTFTTDDGKAAFLFEGNFRELGEMFRKLVEPLEQRVDDLGRP